MTATFLLHAPSTFSFWRTATSHGWYDLLPFAADRERQQLKRVLLLKDGTITQCSLHAVTGGVRVTCTPPPALTPLHRREIAAVLRTCLRIDEDFSTLYRDLRPHPAYRWIARTHAGRLLRAPTVFEDAVKMICTTNCTWALTVHMVRLLVGRFGRTDGTLRAFPLPGDMAGASEAMLRKECSTGYRSRALVELADAVASGRLPIETWRMPDLPVDALYRDMCAVRGIGPYAAGNLLKLSGHYGHLGLDSWVRKQWYRLHNRGRRADDRRIERFYDRFGPWRGLVFWLEMTRDWHEEKFRGEGGA